jgi:hypothetical protein
MAGTIAKYQAGGALPRAWNVDDAALALEEIEPEDKRAARFWEPELISTWRSRSGDMVAAVASHLVKVEPEEARWWINLAYATRRLREHRESREDPAPSA